MCVLLMTTGQKLDNQLKEQEARVKQAKMCNCPAPKLIPEPKIMDNIFDKLEKLGEDEMLSQLTRLALLVSKISKNAFERKNCLFVHTYYFTFTIKSSV
jgi:hypothetical protein